VRFLICAFSLACVVLRYEAFPFKQNRAIVLSAGTGHKLLFRLSEARKDLRRGTPSFVGVPKTVLREIAGSIVLRLAHAPINCNPCDCYAVRAALRPRAPTASATRLGARRRYYRRSWSATLIVDYELPGVIWPMIGLLVVPTIAIYFWGADRRCSHLKGSIRDRKGSPSTEISGHPEMEQDR
jgi:hypothetical protein